MSTARIHTASSRDTPGGWPIPAQRRTVSVLSVDIVGSTDLFDRLDPEDVRDAQRAYVDTVVAAVRRYGGALERYAGTGLLVFFGTAVSDEYDAYRAVRAGLQLRAAFDDAPLRDGLPVRVRVGVATGEALVDLAEPRDGGHSVVSGAVVGNAIRLQEQAPAGAVVVCAVTHRATSTVIRYTPPQGGTGGPSHPPRGWHADGPVRTVTPIGSGAPLVGRRRELAAVVDLLGQVARNRAPRWVSVTGPAGIGKTRLLRELTTVAGMVEGSPVGWHVGYCPPYPDAPLTPLTDMIRARVGILPGDCPTSIRRRLAAMVGRFFDPAQVPEVVDTLEALLVSGGEPGGLAARGAQAWQQVLLRTAAQEPVVVAVDGLDRAAGELTRFLRELFATAVAERLPLAVLVTHRPEWAEAIGAPARELRTAVPVAALDAADTGELLRHLAGANQPTELVDRLVPLAGGNPRYAEEYVRAAATAEAGTPDHADPPVPEAVRRIAAARLDRLGDSDQTAVLAAAALGTGISAEALGHLIGFGLAQARLALSELADQGLLVRTSARPEYDFTDRTLRQVAYDRLPRTVRAEFRDRISQQPQVPSSSRVRLVRRVGEPPHHGTSRRSQIGASRMAEAVSGRSSGRGREAS